MAWVRVCRHPLKAVILVYLVLGAVYSATLPIFEAPDEELHYSYVRYVATEHDLPPWDAASPAGQESSQPPLYYVTTALVTAWVDHNPAETLRVNRFYGNYQAAGTVNDNKNVFLHTDAEALPWRGVALSVHIARLVNVSFGALAVVAIYLLACESLQDAPNLALGAAALVAFSPQFLFISAAVNNDAAAAAFSAATLWLLVYGLRRGFTLSRAVWLGVLEGLAVLSKVSALGLLPLTVLALALVGWQTRRWAEVFRAGIVVLVVVTVVAGWWYARNASLYDDPFGLATHFETWWVHKESLSPAQLWERVPGVELSFWAAFGMGDIRLPGAVYTLLRVLVRLAGFGLVVWGVRAWRNGHRPGLRAYSLALLALWVVLVLVALLRWMQLVEAGLGRLLFPAIGGIAVLLVWGLAQLVPRRFAAWPGLLFAAVLLVAAALSPFIAIAPAYARPPQLSEEQVVDRVHPADLRFGDGIRLAGYKLESRSTRPGDEVSVTLCWEATTPLTQDYAYFIHFLGPAESIIGARNTYPGLGAFPTSQWLPGNLFCDVVRVPVEGWTPVPAVYDVEVGWYDPETGTRLQAYNANAVPMGLVLLDRLKVEPQESLTTPVARRVDADIGGQVTLLGYDVSEQQIAPGQVISLTLYWAAQAPVSANYTVLVHLAAPASPPLAQDDGQPRNGTYPTSFWDVGEVVVDPRAIQIPADLPRGKYVLGVGMYLLETGERLPATGADGTRLPDDVVPLMELEVP